MSLPHPFFGILGCTDGAQLNKLRAASVFWQLIESNPALTRQMIHMLSPTCTPISQRPNLEIFCSPTIFFPLYNLYHIGPISKMTQASTLRQQREVERALNTPEQGGYFFIQKFLNIFFPKADFYKLDKFYSGCNTLLEILNQYTSNHFAKS